LIEAAIAAMPAAADKPLMPNPAQRGRETAANALGNFTDAASQIVQRCHFQVSVIK
jgi:hypothetical protein